MNAAKTTQSARGTLLELIGLITLTGVAAGLGAFASVDAAVFYAHLNQPAWAPPAWLFGPVWSALYLSMAVAAWRIAGVTTPRSAPALLLYLAQLAVNALWSWLFFAWHLGAPALLCIAVLWMMIAATIVLFGRRDRLAALLLWPYLAWVSFAGALCFNIWQRNLSLLG